MDEDHAITSSRVKLSMLSPNTTFLSRLRDVCDVRV